VTITVICTKFGTEHKYHTANTLEWPNSNKLKIQDGGGRHLKFRKNLNNYKFYSWRLTDLNVLGVYISRL